MSAMLFACLFLVLFPIAFFSYRYTPLDLSFKRGILAGVFLYREIFGLVGVAVILLNSFSPAHFHGFNNTREDSVFFISIVVVYALFLFVLFSGLMLKILFSKVYQRGVFHGHSYSYFGSEKRYSRLLFFGVAVAISGMVVNLFGVIFYGARHAFYGALVHGESLLSIRLGNIHVAKMPTVLNSFSAFCYTFLAIVLGGLSYKKNKMLFIFFSMVVLYLATFGGAKAPPVQAVILYLVSFACFSELRFNFRALFKLFIASSFIVGLVFWVVWIQVGGINAYEFGVYLINRLGVGQMAGVYEQFNLKIHNSSYILHSVPFAGFFFDYPVFQKDLMLASENVLDPSSTGVKNSLFISEAYSFGGFYFVLISPVIVGISYGISLFLVFKVLSFILKDPVVATRLSGLFFASYLSLTGGMSEWIFYKAIIMILIFFIPIYFVFFFIKDVPPVGCSKKYL